MQESRGRPPHRLHRPRRTGRSCYPSQVFGIWGMRPKPSGFMRLPAAIGAAMRSTPVETGGSHSGGRKAMLLTSIWRTITEDRFNDQEASQARLAAHASWRTSARGDFAGTRSTKNGDRKLLGVS